MYFPTFVGQNLICRRDSSPMAYPHNKIIALQLFLFAKHRIINHMNIKYSEYFIFLFTKHRIINYINI